MKEAAVWMVPGNQRYDLEVMKLRHRARWASIVPLLVALMAAGASCAQRAGPSAPDVATPAVEAQEAHQRVQDDPAVAEFTGTLEATETIRESSEQAVLTGVQAVASNGLDRIVFEFEGRQPPGYRLEYVTSDVRQCGSGEEEVVEGEAVLIIRLTPARAHSEAGAVTVSERHMYPRLPIVREMMIICDAEGDVEWAVGLAAASRYRVRELQAPTRLIVDLKL